MIYLSIGALVVTTLQHYSKSRRDLRRYSSILRFTRRILKILESFKEGPCVNYQPLLSILYYIYFFNYERRLKTFTLVRSSTRTKILD